MAQKPAGYCTLELGPVYWSFKATQRGGQGTMRETLILNAGAMQRALTRIAHEIAERNETSSDVVLVGIQRGGVPLAQRLSTVLTGIWGHIVPVGSVDVGMHRDDLSRRAAPDIRPTVIPFDISNRTLVLVDD